MRPLELNTIEAPGLEPSARAERAQPAGGADFGAALKEAVGGIEQVQQEADVEANKAALGGGNLHELSIALEKADIAMRVATKVRNKVVDAYHEILRMSV
jgi:flagellar hook-basal body complex protein FliE